jgi:hypothetical protein
MRISLEADRRSRRREDDRDTDDDRDERACVDPTRQPPEARRDQRKDRNDAQETVAQQTEDRVAEALQIGLRERWFGRRAMSTPPGLPLRAPATFFAGAGSSPQPAW